MTQSILLLLAIAAVWYVFVWSMRNDKAASIKDETGFIRLRRVKDKDGHATAKPPQDELRPRKRARGRTSRRR